VVAATITEYYMPVQVDTTDEANADRRPAA